MEERPASRKHLVLAVFFSALLTAILYYFVFLMGYWGVNDSDALYVHLADNHNLVQAFRSGRFPLWDPSRNLGQPVINGFVRIFHPALPLHFFFDPWIANTIMVLVGLFLTCVGAYFLLQQQDFGFFPSLVGAAVYLLCGPVLFLSAYQLDFMAVLLLPWILWIFHRHDSTGENRWLWAGALLCLLAVQGIESDTLFYLYLGLGIDRLVSLPRLLRWNYLLKWSGLLILTGLTGLMFYLPLYEWLAQSSRMAKSYSGVLEPDLLNMLAAVFGGSWLNRWPYDSFYFYFGPALIWLVIAGLSGRGRRGYPWRYFLCSLFIPAFRMLKILLQSGYLDFLSAFESWRSIFVFSLGLAMLAASGARGILEERRPNLWLGLSCSAATFGLAAWLILGPDGVSSKSLGFLLAGAGIIAASLFTGEKARRVRIWGVLAALLGASLIPAMLHTRSINPCKRKIIPWDFIFPSPSFRGKTIEELSGHLSCHHTGTFRFNLERYRILSGKNGQSNPGWRVSVQGFDAMSGFAGLKTLPNYACVYNKNMEESLASDGLIKRRDRLPYWMRIDIPLARALSLYGVRFLVVLGPKTKTSYAELGWLERPDLSWPDHHVWENRYYIGRAYLVGFNGSMDGRGVRVLRDDPERVVIEAEADKDQLLVLADLAYPGWEAYLDGRRAREEVYHGCLRAVGFPSGRHSIEWRYNGRAQQKGIFLSILSFGLLVVFLTWVSFSRRSAGGIT